MELPLVVEETDGGHRVRPVGPDPSSRLLVCWAAGLDLPEGLRWADGTHPRGALPSGERAVDVDQTNASVVVGEQVVVKWVTTLLVGPHPAPERLRRLVEARFEAMPEVWFGLEWLTPEGHWVPVVTAV